MAAHTRFAVLFGLLLVSSAIACSGGTGSIDQTDPNQNQNQTPVQEGQVTSPSSSIQVTASLSAVTLGDDCGSGNGSFAGDSDSSGKCAPGAKCGGGCQQSNMQIAFTATATGQAARIEVAEVTLHDESGNKLDTLTSSSPQSWNGSSYVAWDQTIAPSSTLKTSYNLSAPGWSKIGNSTGSGTGSAGLYSRQYRLRVSLRIDGVTLLLESTVLNREPAVAT